MVSEEITQSPTCVKKDCKLKCHHIRLSLKSLTNASIFELVEAELNKPTGPIESNLRLSQHATSNVSTFLNVLKSSLGSGLLAMPSAFANAGLLVGIVGTFFVGVICAHCTYILVKSSQTLCYHLKKSHLNYPETTEAAFQYGVKGKLMKYSRLARLAQVVKILVGLAILCTYGLQTMAVAQVFWKALQPYVSKKRENLTYYTMRVLMVIGHVISAIVVPQLTPVISLIGAVGLSMLGLALPALLETLTFWEEGLGIWRWLLWKNIFLSVLAVFTLVSGTWVSFSQILEGYSLQMLNKSI